MKYRLDPPLTARDGRVLRVLGVARISTINQDPLSLRDQGELLQQWIADHYDGRFELNTVATQGSGEHLDRKELIDIQRRVTSDSIDLVVMEDLGRYLRDMQAIAFCGLCVDFGTRVVAINDHIDTGRDGWEDNALFAAWRHKRYNQDTSSRIKQRLNSRFSDDGGVFQCAIYGYIKAPGARSDRDVQKDPAAAPIYERWFNLLEDGASYEEVADWLNANHVPVGPSCRRTEWDGMMVGRITHNPIIKGLRMRNRMHTVKHNQSGKRRSVHCDEPHYRPCPHLAFIDPERYDRVLHKLDSRNSKHRRKRVNGRDPCANRPKRRTTWPGQHSFCGICGRQLIYGGHGQKDHLVCKGSKIYRCWNTISVDGPTAASKLAARVLQEIQALPDFDKVFLEKVHQQLDEGGLAHRQKIAELDRKAASLERSQSNLLASLREYGPTPLVKADLDRVMAELEDLNFARKEAERAAKAQVSIPAMDDLKKLARAVFEELACDSAELGRQIKRLIPRIVIYPYRLCDGGGQVQRARFTLNLAPLIAGGESIPELARYLSRELEVDLFDPPQRATYRVEAVRRLAESPGKPQYEVAMELGITETAVNRAVALDRKMAEMGLKDPYLPVLQPPEGSNRLRVHQHARYRFEPLGRFEDEPEVEAIPEAPEELNSAPEAA